MWTLDCQCGRQQRRITSLAKSLIYQLCREEAAGDVARRALEAFSRSWETFRAEQQSSSAPTASHLGQASKATNVGDASQHAFSSRATSRATTTATNATSAAPACDSSRFSRTTRSDVSHLSTGSSAATPAGNSTATPAWTTLVTATTTIIAQQPALPTSTATQDWCSTTTTPAAGSAVACLARKPDHGVAIGLGVGLGVGIPLLICVNWRILRQFNRRQDYCERCTHCREKGQTSGRRGSQDAPIDA